MKNFLIRDKKNPGASTLQSTFPSNVPVLNVLSVDKIFYIYCTPGLSFESDYSFGRFCARCTLINTGANHKYWRKLYRYSILLFAVQYNNA
jgi:hypothetical protein